ncbi:hypothetical protein [Aeoliella sp.]|uniref:hypothetical protein n=1 Tax=Aeoliella sp. TaxID=2795800 RepID=UPI003CCBAFD8
MSESKSTTDNWGKVAVVISLLALCVTFQQRTESNRNDLEGNQIAREGNEIAVKATPDYYASPEDVSYYYSRERSCRGHAPGSNECTPGPSTLRMYVVNEGGSPARDIELLVWPLTNSPSIESSHTITTTDVANGRKLIKLKQLGPHSEAFVELVDSGFDEYAILAISTNGDKSKHIYQHVAEIEDARFEFGQIPCERDRCRECAGHKTLNASGVNLSAPFIRTRAREVVYTPALNNSM